MALARLGALIIITILASVLALPLPGPALSGDLLPDGCLGSLNNDQVVIYYFHRKFRCQSCEVLEQTLQNTITVKYADQFGTGRLAMCVVNLDDPENRYFLDEFEILSNSVVIVRKKSGAVSNFKTLETIWGVSEDSEAISHLLILEMDHFLSEG